MHRGRHTGTPLRLSRRFSFHELSSRCALVVLVLSSCGSPEPRNWPFPEVDGEAGAAARRGDARTVVAVLRERVSRVESLYAELRMAIEGGARSGVFDTVVYYQAPYKMRMTAFRDLLVSTRDVFDLALSEDEYALRLQDEGEEERRRGEVSELGAGGDGFGAFRLLRERIFLPGLVREGEAARIDARKEDLLVTATTTAGEIAWTVDGRTLGVLSAAARGADGETSVEIEYLSYRRVGDVFLPERFHLVDTTTGVSISGWLRYVEVNPELEPAVLEEPFVE